MTAFRERKVRLLLQAEWWFKRRYVRSSFNKVLHEHYMWLALFYANEAEEDLFPGSNNV